MSFFIRVACIFSLMLFALSTLSAQAQSVNRVLFVGNSLTYVGNVPAVFSALGQANGRTMQSDMLVRGGATLTDRLNDGLVAHALEKNHYDVMVLQERGGELMGAFGDAAETQSKAALKSYAALAQQAGVKVFLLGSYQPSAGPSQTLVEIEKSAAMAAGVTYIEVSENLRQLRKLHPDLAWFSTDGTMHPGQDLALLDAVLLYQAMYADLPASTDFVVNAPMYTARYSPNLELLSVDSASAHKDIALGVNYSMLTLKLMIDALVNQTKADK